MAFVWYDCKIEGANWTEIAPGLTQSPTISCGSTDVREAPAAVFENCLAQGIKLHSIIFNNIQCSIASIAFAHWQNQLQNG
jgi:hypothetical protein